MPSVTFSGVDTCAGLPLQGGVLGPLAQLVEHRPFKPRVTGSSPVRPIPCFRRFRPHRLVRSRTPGFHPGNTGSNPVGVTLSENHAFERGFLVWGVRDRMALERLFALGPVELTQDGSQNDVDGHDRASRR